MSVLVLSCSLLALAQSGSLDETPSRTVVTATFLRTSYVYLDGSQGSNLTFGDPRPPAAGFTGRSIYVSSLANRQMVSVAHGANTDFGWDLKIQLSSDIEDWIVGLAGGLELGALALRTEVSRARGQLAPRSGVIVGPGETEFSNRYITFRLGWDGRSVKERKDRVAGVLGFGAIYQTSPQYLRISRNSVIGSGAASPESYPERVVDPEWGSFLAGFWAEFRSLNALVGDDATPVGFLSFVESPGFSFGLAIDTSVLMGIGAGWPGPDADRWVERITGVRYEPPAAQFVFYGMELDLHLGAVAVFEVAGQRFGLQAGIHGGGTVMLALGGGKSPEDLPAESSEGSAPVGVSRFFGGPFVELATRF